MVGGDELALDARRDDRARPRRRRRSSSTARTPRRRRRLGGYFLFECASIDEAVDWAARIPAAEHGAVEVRPGVRRPGGGLR